MATMENKYRFILIYISCIVSYIMLVILIMTRKWFCDADAGHMAQLLRIVLANNSVEWDQFGIKLGFTNDTVNSTTDIDLVKVWINKRLHSTKISVVKLLQHEGYTVEEGTIQIFKGFEKCTTVVWWVIITLNVSCLLLLLFIVLNICLVYCWFYSKKEQRISEICIFRTCDDKQPLIPYYTNDEGAHGIPAHGAISIEDETEPQGIFDSLVLYCCYSKKEIDGPENIYCNGNLFHRPLDTTLQRSSVQQICDIMSSIGILFNKRRALGSVVRVGSKYVITAWHVVEHIVWPGSLKFRNQPMDENLLSASDVYIDFSEYCRQNGEETHFKIRPKIVFVDYQLDIAILDIFGKDKFLPKPVCSFSDEPNLNNDVVHVIGMHPQREIIVADMSCTVINRNDKRVKKAIKWTEKHTTELKQYLVTRNKNPNMVSTAYFDVRDTMRRLICDTHLEYGGSGGAILAFTPEGLVLKAIFIHGLPPFREYFTSEIPSSNKMEVGTTLNAIRDSLEWKPGMEKIKEDIFNMHADMETDRQTEEMDTCTIYERLVPGTSTRSA